MNDTNSHQIGLGLQEFVDKDQFVSWVSENPHCPIVNPRSLLCPICSSPPSHALNLVVEDALTLPPNSHSWNIQLVCKRHISSKQVHYFRCRYCSDWQDAPHVIQKKVWNHRSKVQRIVNDHDRLHTQHGNIDINPNLINQNEDIDFQNEYIDDESYLENFLAESIRELYGKNDEHYANYVTARTHKTSYTYILRKCSITTMIEEVDKKHIITLFSMIKELFTLSRDKRQRMCKIFEGIVAKIAMEKNQEIIYLKRIIDQLQTSLTRQIQMNHIYRSQLLTNHIDPNDIADGSVLNSIDDLPEISREATNKSISLPTTSQELRQLTEGKSSVIENLVTPKVMIVDGYAIVLPSKAIQLYFHLGDLKFESNSNSNFTHQNIEQRSSHLSRNVRKQSVKHHPEVPFVPLVYWSDSAEMSTTKTNRSSGKIGTISFLQYPVEKENVFLIALGSSKLGNFDTAQNRILQDLCELSRNPIRSLDPRTYGFDQVRFGLTTVVQDRPEHDDFTGCIGHGGMFSKVPGISCPIKIVNQNNNSGNDHPSKRIETEKNLMSCNECFHKRLQYLAQGDLINASKSNLQCNECYDWELLSVKFSFNDDKFKSIYGSNTQQAKIVTFQTMKAAMNLICYNVFHRRWPHMYQVRSFAKLECIKQKYADDIREFAKRAYEERQPNPPPIPVTMLPPAMRYCDIELSQCLVGVMHTVVLNGGKVVLSTIKDVLTKEQSWSDFYENTNKLLSQLRSLSLSWLKCWTFGSSNKPGGGWLSENYLGFMTISKSIAFYGSNLFGDERKRDIFRQLICCWNQLVTMILQPIEVSDNHCLNVLALVKIFLNYYALLEIKNESIHATKLESTSCLISLLTISDIMKLHGTQRNLWEGSLFGEGMFRMVKPFVNRGLYTVGTAKNVLDRHYKTRELNSMIAEVNHEIHQENNQRSDYDDDHDFDSSSPLNEDELRYRSFHAYNSLNAFKEKVNEKSPTALIYSKEDQKFYVLVRKGRSKRVIHQLTFNNISEVTNTSIFESMIYDENETEVESIKNFTSCVSIPFQISVNQKDHYILNEERMEYNFHTQTFSYPHSFHF